MFYLYARASNGTSLYRDPEGVMVLVSAPLRKGDRVLTSGLLPEGERLGDRDRVDDNLLLTFNFSTAIPELMYLAGYADEERNWDGDEAERIISDGGYFILYDDAEIGAVELEIYADRKGIYVDVFEENVEANRVV